MSVIQTVLVLAGRFLLGGYFIMPAIMKLQNYEATAAYMAEHGMVLIPFFLVLTSVIQFFGGVSLIIGYRAQLSAFLLAGVVIIINYVMHDFWTYPDGLERAHETQNFFKNLGILGGLLVVAGLGAGPLSLDRRRAK